MMPLRRILVASILVPVGIEMAVRVDDWVRFGVPLTSGATSIDDLQVVDSLGQHARPRAAFRKFRINSLGFRGPEVPDSELRTRPLVVVSGSSESFGLYETVGHEWPRQLSDSLDRRCATTPVTVANAAFAGMALPTVIQDVERRILPLRPTVVVYYPQPMQYLGDEVPKTSPTSTSPPAARSGWRVRATSRVRDDIRNAVPDAVLDYLRRRETEQSRSTGLTLFRALPVERLDSLDAHLRTLVGTVRHGGAAIVIVIPQHRFGDTTSVAERRWLNAFERFVPKASGALILAFFGLAKERIRGVAADSGVMLVEPEFPSGRERVNLFADIGHFTDRGAALMAASTADVLSRFLGCVG